MADPTRKEVESIRKRIDTVNRQLKPLGKSCVKKVRTHTHTCYMAWISKNMV
jgi:hypothetical protein